MSTAIPPLNAWQNIQAISFDLDDTLWDGSDVLIRAEHAMQHWMAQHTPKLHQLSSQQLRAKKIAFAQQHPELIHKMSDLRRAFLQQLFQEFNYPAPLAEQCYQVFYRARQRVIPFNDVATGLTQLATNFTLIAITNGNANIYATALGEHFDFALQADDFTHPKPHPQMFAHALQKLQLPAEQVLHVGDHPQHDMAGAFAMGMKVVWYNEGKRQWDQSFQPHGQVSSMSQLLTLLGMQSV